MTNDDIQELRGYWDRRFLQLEGEIVKMRDKQESFDRILRGDNGSRPGLIHEVHSIGRDTQQHKQDQRIRENKIDELLEELSKSVQPLVYQSKVLTWLGGALGLSILALIWAIIIGQVQIVFP